MIKRPLLVSLILLMLSLIFFSASYTFYYIYPSGYDECGSACAESWFDLISLLVYIIIVQIIILFRQVQVNLKKLHPVYINWIIKGGLIVLISIFWTFYIFKERVCPAVCMQTPIPHISSYFLFYAGSIALMLSIYIYMKYEKKIELKDIGKEKTK